MLGPGVSQLSASKARRVYYYFFRQRYPFSRHTFFGLLLVDDPPRSRTRTPTVPASPVQPEFLQEKLRWFEFLVGVRVRSGR